MILKIIHDKNMTKVSFSANTHHFVSIYELIPLHHGNDIHNACS